MGLFQATRICPQLVAVEANIVSFQSLSLHLLAPVLWELGVEGPLGDCGGLVFYSCCFNMKVGFLLLLFGSSSGFSHVPHFVPPMACS